MVEVKVGDTFPVVWNEDLSCVDGEVVLEGSVKINDGFAYVQLMTDNPFLNYFPKLKRLSRIVITEVDSDGVLCLPIEWEDSNVEATGYLIL